MLLSIVATLFRSEDYVVEFCRRAGATARNEGFDYEIVLVNDGSPDGSLVAAQAAQKDDHSIRIVDLSRNFGHHRAVMTGLEYSRGDLVFLLDVDLEEEPELLARFLETIRSQPQVTDVVYGVQAVRQGNSYRRWTGSLFYRIFNWLSDMQIPTNLCMVRLMTRRYVDQVLRFPEREVVLSGLFGLTGYRQVALVIDKPYKGSTSYGFLRNLDMALTTITSFSRRPLRLIFWLGVVVTLLGIGYAGYSVVTSLVSGRPVPGFSSLLASIWLVGGVLIASLGVVGLYIATIFAETKQRPRTIVRQCLESERLEDGR